MVARQTLDLLVGVQILPGEYILDIKEIFQYKNNYRMGKN